MNQWTIHSADEIIKPVEWLIESLKQNSLSPTIITLQGDLGAGKTTFTQMLARTLGVTETVTSPTFVIQKIYPISLPNFPFTKLVHIDVYRIENENEMRTLGWERLVQEVGGAADGSADDATDNKTLVVIEWPERIEGLLNELCTISFTFKTIDESTRAITAQTKNARA